MTAHTLIFYANRSTAQVVAKGKKGVPKAGYGKVVLRRPATFAEEQAIAKGKWIRVRVDGKKPSDPGARSSRLKGRPKLKTKPARSK